MGGSRITDATSAGRSGCGCKSRVGGIASVSGSMSPLSAT